MSPATGFINRDATGHAILRFEKGGNVIVAGTLTTTATSGDLPPSASDKELSIPNASGDVVARACAQTGNLYSKGALSESVGSLTAAPIAPRRKRKPQAAPSRMVT